MDVRVGRASRKIVRRFVQALVALAAGRPEKRTEHRVGVSSLLRVDDASDSSAERRTAAAMARRAASRDAFAVRLRRRVERCLQGSSCLTRLAGVLWDGNNLYDGVSEALQLLRRRGHTLGCASGDFSASVRRG